MFLEATAAKIAGAVLVGGATLGVGAATTDCPTGQEMTVMGCAKVTDYEDETVQQGTGSHSAVTVDVTFRDDQGNRTTSGMSSQDQFEWLGGKKPGKNGDGMLIEVKQISRGKGGWGPLYQGWIPVKYTHIPRMFD
ncbi:hypothetical protein ACFW2V_13085 [Streptomyces sp. NPDC058947]|uniref:hypothetical protein n=1 Tax=Streptomyces sp. NPDC058947 TaxID=3346675 RepID=UPI0036C4A316